jgi:hypothetical protein
MNTFDNIFKLAEALLPHPKFLKFMKIGFFFSVVDGFQVRTNVVKKTIITYSPKGQM